MTDQVQSDRQRLLRSAPTIPDVAAHAGVSPMTVSRVLAGKTGVSAAKRESVLASVTKLGYRRNENARSLRPGQRTGLVGVIITNVSNPYYAELQLGVEEILSAEKFRLLVGNSGEDPARESQLVADFVVRQVDGLIVVPAGGDARHLTTSALGPIPLVLASRELDNVDADTVVVDDATGAFNGTRKLIAEGHRRIAFVGDISLFTSKRRYEGFVKAHDEAGLDIIPELVRGGRQDTATAQQAMVELLSLSDPPTAVFSANNRNTVGILRALGNDTLARAKGSQVRDSQVRIVGFDNFDLSDMMPFPLTIIDHDARELGRQAGRLLLRRLNDREGAEPRLIQLPTRLLD